MAWFGVPGPEEEVIGLWQAGVPERTPSICVWGHPTTASSAWDQRFFFQPGGGEGCPNPPAHPLGTRGGGGARDPLLGDQFWRTKIFGRCSENRTKPCLWWGTIAASPQVPVWCSLN